MPLQRGVIGGAAASDLLRRSVTGSGPTTSIRVPSGWHDPGWRWLSATVGGGPTPAEAVALLPMPTQLPLEQTTVRRSAEVLTALSAGLDAAERRPEGHALRTAYLAARLADELTLAEPRCAELLYAGLLLDAGSTGLEARDHARTAAAAARGSRSALGRWTASTGPTRESPHLSRTRRAAAMIHLLGLPPGVSEAVTSVDERWDGRGPRHQRHAAIPLGGRVLALASAVAQVGPTAQPAAIERVLRGSRGRELDPELVDHALRMGRLGLWSDLTSADLMGRMLELEPVGLVRLSGETDLDVIAGAFADMIDTRTPRMGRHGHRVSEFAERTGAELGLDSRLRTDLRRAGLLHDIGKLLVPITFLEKPAELTDAERAVVDEHARTGAAILQRSRAFASLGPLIVAHHERLDGYGMFPAIKDDGAAVASRVLALCDRYEAMTAERPYRPLLTTEQVWTILDEVVGEPLSRVALRAMRRAVPSR
jgi:putative nucleotidyltransferase with HDIG domain